MKYQLINITNSISAYRCFGY